ncbi:MAG: oxidoreductase [Sciscionella sp.]
MVTVGLFRRRGKRATGVTREVSKASNTYLESWAEQRRGVEAYVEPKTTVTDTTVLLIAHDGEWTRRRIDGPDAAFALGKRMAIPVYDVAVVGYPQRMRDYTARQRIRQRRAEGR